MIIETRQNETKTDDDDDSDVLGQSGDGEIQNVYPFRGGTVKL